MVRGDHGASPGNPWRNDTVVVTPPEPTATTARSSLIVADVGNIVTPWRIGSRQRTRLGGEWEVAGWHHRGRGRVRAIG